MRTCAAALAGALLAAAPAGASELLNEPVGVEHALERNCIVDAPAGPGVVERSVTVPGAGWVTARLDGAAGDWDIALFDAESGRRVAGGTSFGPDEVAQGLAAAGQRLRVQVCRRSGSAQQARLAVESSALRAAPAVRPSLVIVSTPNRNRKAELLGLGLDVTEHGGPGFVGVLLWGAEDARRLREAKFVYRTVVADLAQASVRRGAADRRFQSSVRASALPSGRDTYRRLDDYTNEMKQLVSDNPGLVKPITLPFKTYLGRSVEGIEITQDVNERDGKPVFLNMGVHHAREWPSGEHAMEWAHELVNGYKAGNERVRHLMRTSRTIVIPIVNPDGFNTSREAGEAAGRGGGGENASGDDTATFATIPYEYQRKNCRVVDPRGPDPERGDCDQQPATGLEQFGVDPNRNYGGFWGGPGNSAPGGTPPGEYEQDYRGEAPFSEPETRNIQRLVSSRQVTTLITNHTASNLILRPPGIQSLGPSPDEDNGYKALADAMAAENGYTSQLGYELYDTTGTTEDWSYFATGGFGFTFEIGCESKDEETQDCAAFYFHPNFEKVVAEYEGTSEEADENGRDRLGNREAYFIAQESTANPARHSVIAGSAPAAAVLRLTKSFKTRTSPVIIGGEEGAVIEFDDKLETVFDPPGGSFAWHVNPSTRPIVAKDTGRTAQGQPSAPLSFSGGVSGTGQPGDDGAAAPSGDAESDDPTTLNDHTIVVPPQGNGVDNAKMTVKIEWATPASDWDVRLYRDENADGQPEGSPLSVSQQGTTNFEQVTISEAVTGGTPALRPGQYVLRVNNFASGPEGNYDGTVTFQGPDPLVKARIESWRLTCEFPEGKVLERVNVTVGRGERTKVDLSTCASSIRRSCVNNRGGARGRRLGAAYLGRSRARQRFAFRGKRRFGRRGLDVYCVTSGGTLRIGYPTKRLKRGLGRALRLRTRRKAVLALTSNERLAVRGVRVGDSDSRVRARLRRAKRVRVGRNTWFVARAGRVSVVFKVREGVVEEVGIADRRLTRSRRVTRRLLSAWRL